MNDSVAGWEGLEHFSVEPLISTSTSTLHVRDLTLIL